MNTSADLRYPPLLPNHGHNNNNNNNNTTNTTNNTTNTNTQHVLTIPCGPHGGDQCMDCRGMRRALRIGQRVRLKPTDPQQAWALQRGHGNLTPHMATLLGREGILVGFGDEDGGVGWGGRGNPRIEIDGSVYVCFFLKMSKLSYNFVSRYPAGIF